MAEAKQKNRRPRKDFKIDLKSIDINKLFRTLLSRKDVMITGLIVLTGLFIMLRIFSVNNAESKRLDVQIKLLEEKAALIEQNKRIHAATAKYIQSLPPALTESQLLDKVSQLAENQDIAINKILPAAKSQTDFFAKTNLDVDIQAKNFRDILKFFNMLEETPSIGIENIRLNPALSDIMAKEPGNIYGVPLNGRVRVYSLKLIYEDEKI